MAKGELYGFTGERGHYTGVVEIINLGDDPILVDFGRITFRNDADAVVDTDNFLNLLLYQGVNYLEVRLLDVPDTPTAFDVNFDEAVFVPNAGTFTIADFEYTVNNWKSPGLTDTESEATVVVSGRKSECPVHTHLSSVNVRSSWPG